MSEMIASTYELLGHIGEGGGGNVFLARHLRLNKMVVMKADKRKSTARPELLRREVDVLKNLSHAYIPKVFDYFIENDTVYTVMDYIEGESLDKPLKRGERFPQAKIVEWAKELLDALKYLHSPIHGDPPRGYVHSDIKPANLMLTPFGTICLIDFNIALALGEENVVGASAGYASPEHYGLDYSSGFTALNKKRTVDNGVVKTEVLNSDPVSNEKTEFIETQKISRPISPSSQSSIRRVIPDVRSDIYSTGATLYHLLSGKRPVKNATEVVPLSDNECSPLLAAIINKAMTPNPDLRYQSAEEMLYDLEHIRENDPRVKKRKRRLAIFEGCMGAVFALGLFTAFTGLKRIQATDNALKLAEYSESAMERGNTELAVEYAVQALPQKKTIFTPEPSAQAQCALAAALKVYDLSDSFKADKVVELPSEPTDMALSPDGKTFVCVCSGEAVVCDCESGTIIDKLPADNSALAEVKYISGNVIVYSGSEALKVYNVAEKTELWSGSPATALSVSEDGGSIAAVYKDETYAVIYDAQTGKEKKRVDFGGRSQSVKFNDTFLNPHDNLLALNADGSLLAVSFSDGTLSVFDTASSERIYDFNETGYTHFEGGFYGNFLVFSAVNTDGSKFTSVNFDDGTGGEMEASVMLSCAADKTGAYLQTENLLVRIDPKTGEQTPLVGTSETVLKFAADSEHAVIVTESGAHFFDGNAVPISSIENTDKKYTFDMLGLSGGAAVIGSHNSNYVRVTHYESRSDTELFAYDTAYEHTEARVSADGKTVMLFRHDIFHVFGINGELIKTVEIPDADKVYDQQYIRENGASVLEVIYYSGRTLIYSGADGSLIREETRDAHDKNIEDMFFTDELKIVSPLHGAPHVYDKISGELLTELSEDAYLTYVTQQGEYIIAQYVRTDGEFYGVLMNEKCEALARLPRLCDVYDGELIFDYQTGNLRKMRIYKLNELIDLAQNK